MDSTTTLLICVLTTQQRSPLTLLYKELLSLTVNTFLTCLAKYITVLPKVLHKILLHNDQIGAIVQVLESTSSNINNKRRSSTEMN